MENEKLKNIAEKIRRLSQIPEEEQFGSVIAILMIISIAITLIRVLQECNKNKLRNISNYQDKCLIYGNAMRSYAIKKSWLTKLRIKRVIKQNMSKDQYAKYGQNLLEALLDVGQNINDEDITAILESAKL